MLHFYFPQFLDWQQNCAYISSNFCVRIFISLSCCNSLFTVSLQYSYHFVSCARAQGYTHTRKELCTSTIRQVLPLYSLQLLFMFFHAFIVMACSSVYVPYFFIHFCCYFCFFTLFYSLFFISTLIPIAAGSSLVFYDFCFCCFLIGICWHCIALTVSWQCPWHCFCTPTSVFTALCIWLAQLASLCHLLLLLLTFQLNFQYCHSFK